MNRYFSSQPVFDDSPTSIDRSAGLIKGVTVAKVGMAKGHNVKIDRKFLQQIVDHASERQAGIKARFGHPNACSTALGTYLGRFKNFAYHGDHVSADLHLDDTAKKSPSGDLYEYVLEMAEKNPDMFGASIAFKSGDFEELEEQVKGKTVKSKFFRLEELHATDIVDSPAATDGLFSSDSMPAQATLFLDQNPNLAEFIFSKPDRVIEFLNNYLNSSDMNLSETIKSKFKKFFSLESSPAASSDDSAVATASSSNEKNPPPIPPDPNPNDPTDPTDLTDLTDLTNPTNPSDSNSAILLSELQSGIKKVFLGFLEASPDPSIRLNNEGHYFIADGKNEPYVLDDEKQLLYMLSKFESQLDTMKGLEASLDEKNTKLSELATHIPELTTLKDKAETSLADAIKLNESLTAQVGELESLLAESNDKLSAKPSIPKNVTDPKVDISLSETKVDDTGKEIMKNMPADERRKIKKL